MGGVSITDIYHGYEEALEQIKILTLSAEVKVGVDDRQHAPTGQPTDEIGAYHEFGTETIPQRSFLRGWVDQNQVIIRLKIAEYAWGQLFGGEDWRIPFGAWAVTQIRARIWAQIPPPLRAATARRKKTNVPLIDSGQLVNAIVSELEK